MKTIRQWHTYIGLFTAPSVLFFSLTGAVQLFNLHEAHGSYRPLAVVEMLSSVHKDQVFAFGDHHPKESDADPSAPAADAATNPAADEGEEKTALPVAVLKGFFLLIALSLSVSTLFGVWMAIVQARLRTVAWCLIGAGIAFPIVTLLF